MRRLLLSGFPLISAMTMLAVFSGCGGGTANTTPGGNPPVLTSIQVTGPSATLTVGQQQQMTATGIYNSGPTKNLTNVAAWSSSTGAISVSVGGMVTGNSTGTSTISAKLGNVTGSANLTVGVVLVSIAVTPANPAIAPSTTQQFIATGTYSDASTQNLTGSVTWNSSNTTAATIGASSPTQGLATALAAGNSTISATLGTISGSTTLTVTSAVITSIVVTPTNANIPLGIAQQFTATGTFSDSSVQDVTGIVTWKSSITSIASITVSGRATGLNIGTSTISATLGAVSGSAPLMVNAANLSSIAITPGNGSIAQGTTAQLTATGIFNDGGTRNLTAQVLWSSSDTTVATIGASTGIVNGLPQASSGTTIITATLGTVSTSVNFTVTNATISSISVTPTGVTVPIGGQRGFTATGQFSDSTTQDITANCNWTSGNTSVATLGSGGGMGPRTVTGVGAGTANINASFAGVSGFSTLTVSSASLVSLALSPATAILSPGSTTGYSATGTFSDGSHQPMNGAVTWTSSNTLVATVFQSGVVTGQSAGAATIKIQSGAISATAGVVVEGSTLSSVQILPTSVTIPESLLAGFTATGVFANGDTLDLTGVVSWTSSVPSVATISNATGSQGVANCIAPGGTVISGLFAGQVGTAPLTVTNATLVSISVTPASASISLGSSQQFKAVGTFSDGSMFNLTSQANWSSSNIPVAIVNSAGLASSAGSGSSTITATMNGVNGTAILTVQ